MIFYYYYLRYTLRMEFKVTGNQYGMLVEGDLEKLKFQGTRFLDFTRQ